MSEIEEKFKLKWKDLLASKLNGELPDDIRDLLLSLEGTNKEIEGLKKEISALKKELDRLGLRRKMGTVSHW